MFARSTTFQAEPASIDAGIAYMRDTVLPALEELGAAGMSLMVDRRFGRCIATSAWEPEADSSLGQAMPRCCRCLTMDRACSPGVKPQRRFDSSCPR